jgi:hypothetical protein
MIANKDLLGMFTIPRSPGWNTKSDVLKENEIEQDNKDAQTREGHLVFWNRNRFWFVKFG